MVYLLLWIGLGIVVAGVLSWFVLEEMYKDKR